MLDLRERAFQGPKVTASCPKLDTDQREKEKPYLRHTSRQLVRDPYVVQQPLALLGLWPWVLSYWTGISLISPLGAILLSVPLILIFDFAFMLCSATDCSKYTYTVYWLT